MRNDARLVVVAARYGEVCDFIAPPPAGSIMPSPQRVRSPEPTGVWLRPSAGGEVATLAALGRLLAERLGSKADGVEAVLEGPSEAPGVDQADLERAAEILRSAGDGKLAVVFAPSPAAPATAAEAAKACANLAILCTGAPASPVGRRAAECLIYLPAEANVNGMRDMGVRPGAGGQDVTAMLAGGVRALVVVGDNPAMHARGDVEAALRGLDCLVVVDSLQTDTARLAHAVLADAGSYAKDGTYTSADRRVLRRAKAEAPAGDQRDCLDLLSGLAEALSARLSKQAVAERDAAVVMNEIAGAVAGYADATDAALQSGETRALPASPSRARLQAVAPPAIPASTGSFLLTTHRTLYTSLEGASIHSPEADKLHREEFLEMNPADAGALGIGQNQPVLVRNGAHEATLSAALTDAVAPGSVFLPLYFDGGLVNRLLPADGSPAMVTVGPGR